MCIQPATITSPSKVISISMGTKVAIWIKMERRGFIYRTRKVSSWHASACNFKLEKLYDEQ